jgi:exonuclease SbcC
MANFQPKIYSLSTLNVRQHFNCDYRFHDFRTDFSGESGSGKSLIADFIQLLLAGSRVFKSGTEGVKHRDTSGLVLKSAGGKYGRGYIFINVEVQPRKYIALGGYLETTSSQMQFFVIQAGYDFEETLMQMNEPVFYRDLLVDGQIDTLENVEKSFLEKGYLKGVSNKKYHHLLFNNGILAVDLSQNLQSLKSYAAIIRSFSRGKGFFTDSDALKTFLFGDDDQKQLIDKYREEVQNINVDHQQHQRLLEEIATIKSKEQKIEHVLRDFKAYHQLKMQFSLENVSFWFQENTRLSEELEQLKLAYQISSAQKFLVEKKLINKKIADIKDQYQAVTQLKNKSKNTGQEKEKLEAETQRTKKLLDESSKYKDAIDIVSNWFTEDRQDVDAIRRWHLTERARVTDAEALKAFEIFLKEQKLQQAFEQSDWFKEYAKAGKLTLKKLNDLEEAIAKEETQLLFSDLGNPASLAHWAIEHLTLPLSVEQESLLIHFQSLSRTAPIPPAKRYLPFPEKLFKNPATIKTNNNGFWLELNGLYEFIPNVAKQHLNVPTDQIKLDREPLKAFKEQLDALKLTYEQLKNLKEKLEGYPALEKMISLYKASQSELFTEIDEIAELTSSELEKHLLVFQNSKQHMVAYKSHKDAYDHAYASYTLSQQADKNTQEKIDQIGRNMEKQYGSTDFEQLLKEEESSLLRSEKVLENFIVTKTVSLQRIQRQETELFKIFPSLNKLYEMARDMEAQYNEAKKLFQQKQERYNSSIPILNEAKLKFMIEHHRDFVAEQDLIKIEHQPDENKSENARSKFIASYEWASDEIEDKTILKDHSVGVLAHKLLPTVFPTQQIQEELIGEQIEKRLTELTNDLQRIGSRKIEILHNVFNEVQKVYNDYLTRVQRITKYLSSNEITGGNYATLQHKPAFGYPDDWMKVFRKRLTNEMQDVGLFASSNKQDIDEIMISVFREANGTRDATVPDLLNPRSYFDLLFEIKLGDGESNSGSNGQTYTANALLCLARLSLIEDKDHSGIRIMPIDEAEGLGSNYEMLHALAKKENYQIITMSIETAGDINDAGQYIYIMHDNKDATGLTYVPPLGIFHKGQLTENINEIFEETT